MTQNKFKIYLNGILQSPTDIDGAEDVTFSYVKKQPNGEAANSYSQTLTFRGDAYDYLKQEILNHDTPMLATVDVLVKDVTMTNADGSEYVWFYGKIQGADVEEFPLECYVTAPIIDNSEKAQHLICLKNTLIWDRKDKYDGSGISDGENSYRTAPYLPYCVDNDAREALMVLGMLGVTILSPLVKAFALIVTVLNAIIKGVNLVPGVNIPEIDFDGNDDTNAFEEMDNVVDRLKNLVTGCGRRHKVPFLHSYLQNACDICGLTLSSSLFEPNSPYHNAVRLDATRQKGGLTADKIESAYEANKPNMTYTQFLDELCGDWIKWELTGTNGNVLSIEPLDAYQTEEWFNLSDLPTAQIVNLQYSILNETPPAMGMFSHIKDGLDTAGDEVQGGWSDFVIDFNDPPLASQKGHIEKSFPYGAARFRRDHQADDVAAIDKLFFLMVFADINFFQNSHALLLGRHTVSFPKIVLYDGISDIEYMKPERIAVNNKFDYCVPLWLKENYVDPDGNAIETLYNHVFQVFNPRSTSAKLRSYSLELLYDCDLLRGMSVNKSIQLLNGKEADIEQIEVSPNKGRMVVSGKF